MSQKATSLAQADTIYSADSIEWCPFEGYQDLFVCGTYQVLEPTKPKSPSSDAKADDEDEHEDTEPRQTQRTGRLLLFRVEEDEDGVTLHEQQRIPTAAILDTKWSPSLSHGRPILGVADAKGSITTYELSPDTRILQQTQKIQVDDDSSLCLSLDWSDRFPPTSSPPSLITSLSTGSLAHLVPTPTGLEVVNKWKAHDYEPWITAFDQWDPNLVWSGGDDCKLKSWDLRDTSRAAFVNKTCVLFDGRDVLCTEGADRRWDAGVTTITPSPHTPHLLAVGSYDSNLRLFDSRNARAPLLTIPCNGGIWRTRFHPSPERNERKGDILLACMHGGFSVVHLGDTWIPGFGSSTPAPGEAENAWNEVVRFEEHGSLAYGADWSRLSPRHGQSLVATCSFYDHTLHLWRA